MLEIKLMYTMNQMETRRELIIRKYMRILLLLGGGIKITGHLILVEIVGYHLRSMRHISILR
jgi:hypothetical protein